MFFIHHRGAALIGLCSCSSRNCKPSSVIFASPAIKSSRRTRSSHAPLAAPPFTTPFKTRAHVFTSDSPKLSPQALVDIPSQPNRAFNRSRERLGEYTAHTRRYHDGLATFVERTRVHSSINTTASFHGSAHLPLHPPPLPPPLPPPPLSFPPLALP